MIDLIETVVKALDDRPDDVMVTVNEDDRNVTYNLTVHKDDVGKVIGKQGRVAKAIRTVVYAAATNESKRIHLEIM